MNLPGLSPVVRAGRWCVPALCTIAFSRALSGQDAASLFSQGREQFRSRDFAAAATNFERAIVAEPKSSKYHQWLGRALGFQAGQKGITSSVLAIGRVRSELEQAIALDPNNLEARLDLIIFYRAVPGLLGGSRAKASQQLAEIKARDPSLGAQTEGDMLGFEKKYPEAESCYLKAIRANPSRPMPHVRLALVQQQNKQWDLAFASLQRALAIDPKLPLAIYQVGRTGAMSGERLDLAEQSLKRYLQLKPDLENPSPSAAHFRLGSIYQKKGDLTAARGEYNTALKLDPKNKEAGEALRTIPAS